MGARSTAKKKNGKTFTQVIGKMLKTQIKVAVVQLAAGQDKQANIEHAARLLDEAAAGGAEWVLFPECFIFRGKPKAGQSLAEKIPGPTVKYFQSMAKAKGVFLLMGSIHETAGGQNKSYNTSVFIDAQGRVVGSYRKRHLFQACVDGKTIREADIFLPGRSLTLVRIGSFQVGAAICYDVRFPAMFESYAKKGCSVMVVPSNFTYATGQDHWEALLRARAIENHCYILAPNQYGIDNQGVRAYGHSMIVDPWGRILARAADEGDAILFATLDYAQCVTAKQRLS